MPIKINSSGGGSITLAAPSTASDYTHTLPAVSGNVVTTGSSAVVAPAMLSTGAPSWDSSGNLSFNSGYGSVATAYACRAWVNFNGTGAVAIRAGGNVTSITDHNTGEYSVNMTTAMPDINYAVIGQAGSTADTRFGRLADDITARTTSAFRFYILQLTTTGVADAPQINIAVFR